MMGERMRTHHGLDVGLPVSPLRYAAFLRATLAVLSGAPRHPGRFGVLEAGLAAAPPGLGIELGVYRGASLSHVARRQPWRRFHGFDSLSGFPEDGRPDWRHDFSLRRAPRLPPNCTLHVGFFEQTLPPFLARLEKPIGLVNLDCDIHSSARFALLTLAPHLRPGMVVHVDEAVNYDTWIWNEMLALFEMLEASGLGIAWIARAGGVRSLEQTLALLEAGRYPAWADDVAAGFARGAVGVLTAQQVPLDLAGAVGVVPRLIARTAAHVGGTQRRRDCHPLAADRPPPPRLAVWRRWLRRR